MSISRQDRINLHKNKRGIASGEPNITELQEGIPVVRSVMDNETGEEKIIQYIKSGPNVLKSNFENAGATKSNYSANWFISKALDLNSGTGVYKMINVPANSYVTDVKIAVVTAITAGSMDIDVGDGDGSDRYINGWDGDNNSNLINQVHTFGISSGATEVGTATGYYYENQDTIDVDINTVASEGSIRLLAYIINNPIESFTTPLVNRSPAGSYGG